METGLVLEKEPRVLCLTGNRKSTACHTEQSLRKRAQSRAHSDTLPPDGMVCPPASRSGLKAHLIQSPPTRIQFLQPAISPNMNSL